MAGVLGFSIVLKRLFDAGCTGKNYRRAMALLNSGALNIGLTYTNKDDRETIIVIGYSSDVAEFVNTLTHEINHFIEHVMEDLHIQSLKKSVPLLSLKLFELLYRDAVSSVLPLL